MTAVGTAAEIETLRKKNFTKAAPLEEGSTAAGDEKLIGPLLPEEDMTEYGLQQRAKFAQQNRMVWALWEELEIVHPVGRVFWVHMDRVQANDWNPNSVAHHEMDLLHTSISSDGYTMPIVTIWDPETGHPHAGSGRSGR